MKPVLQRSLTGIDVPWERESGSGHFPRRLSRLHTIFQSGTAISKYDLAVAAVDP